MSTISLCMIVKNEEDVLARCLESVAGLVDEIVIVDTGSTDRTKEIASGFTDKIYDFVWVDDFAAARNFAFSKGTCEYLMWLDADDIILPADKAGMLKVKGELGPQVPMVMMPYNIAFDQNGKPTFSYYRERIMRKDRNPVWEGAIHEVITPFPGRIHVPWAVTHRKIHPGDPDRNLRIFEKMIADGKTLEPRQQYYYARELYYHARWQDAIRELEAFLDGGKGWVENNIDACRILSECYEKSGDRPNAHMALYRSFVYDLPRAETCCALGHLLLGETQYKKAIYWYDRALAQQLDVESGGFVNPDCYDYLPLIQMCVCYDRLGDHATANAYNELAAHHKPEAPAVVKNRAYFQKLGF